MYISRHIEEQVLKASSCYPVVMVCGQRQVGKSTMLNHIRNSDRRYVTLDDGNARRLAENDSALFFENYGYPLLIDEFQRVPSLLLEMKRIVDAKLMNGDEDCNGMYWLTGSQKFEMMKNVSESLAGRVAVLNMSSLSTAELEERPAELFMPDIASVRERSRHIVHKDIHKIFELIYRGGMPRLCTTDIDRDRYYMDYVNTYLERDVMALSQIGKLSAFYDFLVFMAARTAQELKYDEIAAAIGISAPTAREWVSILERSGIIYILRPYFSNITKRLVKTPKMYFMDTGLAAYLCRWPDAETLCNGAMDGAFFETYVISEIVKNRLNAGKPADLYYYRDVDRKEVDLLICEGNKIYPIEIKKAKNPADPARNLAALQQLKSDIQPALILCMSDELVPYNSNVWLCPAAVI